MILKNKLLFLILFFPILGFCQYHLIKKDTIFHPISNYHFEKNMIIAGHKNETIFGTEFGVRVNVRPIHLTTMYSAGNHYSVGIHWEFGHLFNKKHGRKF